MFQAYLGMLFCIIIWGSNFVAGSWLVQQFNPLALPAIRILCTSIFLIAAGLLMHKFTRISKSQLTYLLIIGCFGTLINQLCFFQSVTYTSPTESALIMSTSPIATSLFAYILLKEKITLRMIAGSIVAVTGVYILVAHGKGQIHMGLGDLYAVGAMLSFSLNLVLIRKLSDTLDTFVITVYSTLIGTGMFIPVAISTTHHQFIVPTAFAWIVAILSGVLSQGVGGLIWNRGMAYIGAAKASVIVNLQPFVAMGTGYLVMGIPVTKLQLLGGGIIIVGVIFASVKLNFKKQVHPLQQTAVSSK